jgi:hypothetical protein
MGGQTPFDRMNTTQIPIDRSLARPLGLKGAVESFEMYDQLGNCAASALFKTGPETFEVYFWLFNDTIPKRTIGTLKRCKAAMNRFFYRKQGEGFVAAQDWTPKYNHV